MYFNLPTLLWCFVLSYMNCWWISHHVVFLPLLLSLVCFQWDLPWYLVLINYVHCATVKQEASLEHRQMVIAETSLLWSQVHFFRGSVPVVVQGNPANSKGGGDISDNWLRKFHRRKLCPVLWSVSDYFLQHQCQVRSPKSKACAGI